MIPFEKEIAADNVSADGAAALLDYPAYFDLLGLPLPESREGVLAALEQDGMIVRGKGGQWAITNLGAVLLAKRLTDFGPLGRKAVRVVVYEGDSRLEAAREQSGNRGYAAGFERLIESIVNSLPRNEVIGRAFRRLVPMIPEEAIRELVANALIHQDFHVTGAGPMVEIFLRRMEVTNPGPPLVQTERFLDSPPQSRNETLASFMRRIGICEERGTGIDKVVFQTEFYQLPAPLFEAPNGFTRTVLFYGQDLKRMDRADRIRASYLHACLRYVQHEFLTNASLRTRFGLEDKGAATVSRYIREAVEAGMIRAADEKASRKMMKYVPFWA